MATGPETGSGDDSRTQNKVQSRLVDKVSTVRDSAKVSWIVCCRFTRMVLSYAREVSDTGWRTMIAAKLPTYSSSKSLGIFERVSILRYV
jgi:hypothetical protein